MTPSPLPPLSVLLLGTLAASGAQAQTPFDDGWVPADLERYSDFYNGSFTALEAQLGRPGLLQDDAAPQGWALDVGVRAAFPMSLLDTRLGYRYDALSLKDGDLSTHGLRLDLAVHPLYIFNLGSDWLSYAVGGLHLHAGLGPMLGRAPDSSVLAFSWQWGAGLDLPLWNADAGQAPWLNLIYRNLRADLDFDARPLDLSTHTLMVGLSWRTNGLPF